MGLLNWIFETIAADDTPEGETYTIAPGYEDYVHSLPAVTDGDYQGALAEALIHAGILIPADGSQADTNDFDWGW